MNSSDFKKTKDFLSQIPEWEEVYKNSDITEIDFEKSEWKSATAQFSQSDLKIFGHVVMEDWESPYMKVLADICTKNGGVVLELGFGMGISAKFIQLHCIKKRIIIEANHQVAAKAREFAEIANNEVVVLEGFWEEIIDSIDDNSLDGILFDTYPLEESELYQNHFNFFPFAFKKLKQGGIFTYYSDEVRSFGDINLKRLIDAGFKMEGIMSRVVNVCPPIDCEYWKAQTILAPIIVK